MIQNIRKSGAHRLSMDDLAAPPQNTRPGFFNVFVPANDGGTETLERLETLERMPILLAAKEFC